MVFLVLVFCVQAPLLLFIMVMSLSCIVWFLIVGQWYVNLTVILCWLSWFFVARSFVWLVSMLLIVILTVMSSLLVASMLLILLSPFSCAAISLIVLWMAVAHVLLKFVYDVFGLLCCEHLA